MSLEEKLKKISLNKKKRDAEIDWDERRDTWIKQLETLYSNIENWLKSYIDKNYISLHSYEISLTEEHMGTYPVNVFELDLGDPLVVFRPIGKNIIGADGRVDVYVSGHPDDKKMLILTEDDEKQRSHWELWEPKNKKDRKAFNPETLERTLEDWLQHY